MPPPNPALKPIAKARGAVGVLALIGLLWLVCRRTQDPGITGAVANDCALPIPMAVFRAQGLETPLWLKGSALLFLSPVPTMLLISPKPWLGQLPAVWTQQAVFSNRYQRVFQCSRTAAGGGLAVR